MSKAIEKIDTFFERIGMEWQYILFSKSYVYRYKCGRSTKFNARISDIRRTMSCEAGKDIHLALAIKMPVFFAGKNEKIIHRCILWRKADGMPGSGRTEWSWSVNVYTMIVSYLILYGLGWPLWLSLAIMAIPLPLDFVLLTVLLALVQYTLAFATIYGLFKLFFLMPN